MPASGTSSLIQPIIVMIIFVVISLVQRAMTKKPKQQSKPAPRQNEDYQPDPLPQKGSEHKEPHGDLGRTLDNILGELGLPVPHEQEPEREEESLETKAEPKVAKPAPVESQVPQKSVPSSTVTVQNPDSLENAFSTLESAAYTMPTKSISSGPDIYSTQTKKEKSKAIDFTEVSATDIQRFIVWNEILGKPKSLRENCEVEL